MPHFKQIDYLSALIKNLKNKKKKQKKKQKKNKKKQRNLYLCELNL